MTIAKIFAAGAALIMLSTTSVNAGLAYTNKPVVAIHSPDDRPCTFFQLQSVPVADPVNPGSPWFAVPNDHLGYFEIFSMLVNAFNNGTPVSVTTTGGLECGIAGVLRVKFEQ